MQLVREMHLLFPSPDVKKKINAALNANTAIIYFTELHKLL